MNALLLPGNSSRHREWSENLKQAIATHFQHTVIQYYRHWQTGGDKADIENEITIAQAVAGELDSYIIIAKSIGTVIAVKGTAEGILKPTKLILLGIPINGDISKDLFSVWLHQLDVEVVIVQNSNDPLGSFSDVRAAFRGRGEKITFVELPGDTHDYLDFIAIAKLI